MRFENDFYQLLTLEDAGTDAIRAEVSLVYPHRIYEGHFPGKPVVPGVCTLTLVREILSSYLQRPVALKRIKECKFVSPLIPSTGLKVGFEMQLADGAMLKCTVRSEDRTVLKLKAEIGSI